MKTLESALVALTFVAGVVGPAIAAEPFSIKTLDQDHRGGHGYSGSVIEQLDKEGRCKDALKLARSDKGPLA